MYQESGFWGAFFGTVYCRIAGALTPGPPPGLCPGPTVGLIAPSPPPPRQPATPGNEIRSLHIELSTGTTFIHAFTTNLAHHSKFLKKRPEGRSRVSFIIS